MKIWAVTMVKDEADVFPYTLRHMAAQVDGVIVTDNGSTDGTLTFARVEVVRGKTPVLFYDDPEPANHQHVAVNRMVAEAAALGADWVVPFDADELWSGVRRLERVPPEVDVVGVYPETRVANERADDPSDPNPCTRMLWCESQPRCGVADVKVALRPRTVYSVAQGQHYVWHRRTRSRVVPYMRSGVSHDHYPWRSREQMVRKMLNLHRSYKLIGQPGRGGLSAVYGPKLELGWDGEAAWREICDVPLTWRPSPWEAR